MDGGYRIAVVDGRDLSDDDVRQGNDFNNLLTAEILPDEAPMPGDDAVARHHAMPERVRRWSVRAQSEDGTLVGLTGMRIDPEHDDNPDLIYAGIGVHADHRRRGVGTMLLRELVKLARAEGRTRIHGEVVPTSAAGVAFASAVGGEVKAKLHLNHLPTAEVDHALMEAWVKEGPTRAPDYELVAWDGPTPDEHLEQYTAMVMVMNTAPRDDLNINDFTITPEMVREHEKMTFVGGLEMWTVVARRKSDGVFAGFHNVAWVPSDPGVVWVHMTGVHPDHRGHALGKWLKAVMTLRILDERPGVADIRTGNADSNDAMLGINHQMGYRPMLAAEVWEFPIDALDRYLASRTEKPD